jgi:hypothetical protein
MRATQQSQPYEYRECTECGAVYPPSDDGELCDVCADDLADREADEGVSDELWC